MSSTCRLKFVLLVFKSSSYLVPSLVNDASDLIQNGLLSGFILGNIILEWIFHLGKVGKWKVQGWNVDLVKLLIKCYFRRTVTLIRPRVLVQEMQPKVRPWKAPRKAKIDSFFPSPSFSFELYCSSAPTSSVPRSRFM